MQQGNERKYKHIERQQMVWGTLDLQKLVPADDPARVIWELTGKLDLSAFEARVRTLEGQAGSPAWPPRLLLSVWLYAYQQGIASANRLSQMMEWHPGLMVLTGQHVINVHTLCDFRTAHGAELDALLQQLLALLSEEGLVDLRTVMHDGTKIQARAGQGSGYRRNRIQQKLDAARAYMQELDERTDEGSAKKQAAQQRAARERIERLQQAYEAFNQVDGETETDTKRVSITEPEARRMRHTQHGGTLYSYNVQLTTEAQGNFIVGVSVSQDHNDLKQLEPALQTVQHFTGKKPERIVVDGGYVTRNNIEAVTASGVELIAPVKEASRQHAATRARHGVAPEFDKSEFTREGNHLRCPAGQVLLQIGEKKHHGHRTRIFQADAAECGRCPHKQQCCPRMPARLIHQVLESEAVLAHAARMETQAAKLIYKCRSKVAEFANMRIKSDWAFRRFSVRGRLKATAEALLIVVAYNFSLWQSAGKRAKQ